MALIQHIVDAVNGYVWDFGIEIDGETLPLLVLALLGTGVFLTFRLGFLQVRKLLHGFAVASGRYDDPDDPGDVSHFQALTTALSATVGIGNIAGVAIAIHWGGPGALFWMWVTALLGMATKYTEVTLALRYRDVGEDRDPHRWEGSVSGGPMYTMERGLGWKPLAVFFAVALGLTSFLTGNAIQANTVADTMETFVGVPPWVTGLVTATVVAAVILGGISRIGRVTGIVAPLMAGIYVLGALAILALHMGDLPGALARILTEAFSPRAGVAGTGTGAFLLTMMWGVKRGLFSNEAGQGSAPIAHAAAKTEEPVSEGVVALVEPFIDTIVICTMTGLVVLVTGAWSARIPTEIALDGGDLGWVQEQADGRVEPVPAPAEVRVENGRVVGDSAKLAWHEVAVEPLYADAAMSRPFTGRILPAEARAVADDGTALGSLHGEAVENGAPLTMLAFERGLPGTWGRVIVVLSVFLFAISTAISWSYYGDRCAHYLFGPRAVLPYKIVYVIMHFVGAVLSLTVAWTLGDIFLGIVILPNLLSMILLSRQVADMTRSYFERRPWERRAGG